MKPEGGNYLKQKVSSETCAVTCTFLHLHYTHHTDTTKTETADPSEVHSIC